MSDPLHGGNLAFVEALYQRYVEDPHAVDADWRAYFQRLNGQPGGGHTPSRLGPSFRPGSVFSPSGGGGGAFGPGLAASNAASAERQDRVDQLIRAFRVRGHKIASLDPLGLPREPHPELELSYYGLTEADLDRTFSTRTIAGTESMRLRDILSLMQDTYCRSIGVQFMHIDDVHVKHWLQTRMEATRNNTRFDREEQLYILKKLSDAEIFEQFIHTKFVGAKRFSLEGGETLIPLLAEAVDEAANYGVEEVVIGMAHRGRLNVLANIMGKNPAQIFREFADADPELHFGRGDVKYHMGYSSDIETPAGHKVHLTLCFNPSHLEFVDPVAIGRVRAKQERRGDLEGKRVMPLLIHGDAAFIGQGIVQETLNISELPAYTVGGTVHVIVNNQIGFTTPPESSRSCDYPTDIAKMLQVPIFHVNGEHPESVHTAIRLAMAFRAEFHRDVIIDLWCYRKYGHNEGDEPAFTQPVMYKAIRKRPTVRESYVENIVELGEIDRADADRIAGERRKELEAALSAAHDPEYEYEVDFGRGIWTGYFGGPDEGVEDVDTSVPLERLQSLTARQMELPDNFKPHPKLKRLFNDRTKMANGEKPLDWGAAESLAFASLVTEGVPVRISGQDSGRGTFSHRHAVLHDNNDGHLYVPMSHLSDKQGRFQVWDSSLSESAVLGFEFGFSMDTPDGLVIWEAQFGDFCNGAQVIIDQFIVSTEDKWHRLSGLTMLLPHGFEGQGPEHSSARLERFLSMCAEDNIQVCNLTTPAQVFHCLRRQVVRPIRKPLVIMTPKSLLRHPRAVSDIDELASGGFQRIIPDDPSLDRSKVRRVLICSGKIYYELEQTREVLGTKDVGIVRFEQLYPLRRSDLEAAFDGYPDDAEVIWVQEEPHNMGAWPYLRLRLANGLLDKWKLGVVSRRESASPATGSAASHRMEQELLIENAFNLT